MSAHDHDAQPTDHTPRVVVAVDGSSANAPAVQWAAEAAAVRGVPLELLYVVDEAMRTSPYVSTTEIKMMANLAVAPAMDAVAETHPSVQVIPHKQYGHPARTLRHAAEGANMLVLGRRGHGRFSRILLGSVSSAVANQATVPTVVVPKEWDARSHTGQPVVVGVDGTPASDAALELAVDLAGLAGVPLRVVNVWGQEPFFTAETTVAHGGMAVWRTDAGELVRAAVEPWRSKFPDLEIVEVVHQGHIVGTLAEESESAQAIVVGGHKASRMHALVVGSTTAGMLTHAQCPVIVVPVHEVVPHDG